MPIESWLTEDHRQMLKKYYLSKCKSQLQSDGCIGNTQLNMPYNWIPPAYLHTATATVTGAAKIT